MTSTFPLIQLVGPTASGKSSRALFLAKELGAEIVNFDSVQMYRHLDVGSAKPTLEEREKYRHWLVDFLDYPLEMTAGQFKAMALDVLSKRLHEVPLILVGGSGFYLKALQTNMHEVAEVSAEAKALIEKADVEVGGLYRWLCEVLPEKAKRIHPNDSYRIQRSLGLYLTHGRTDFSSKEPDSWPYGNLKIGLHWSRELLRERIRKRVDHMLAQGLLEEVEALKSQFGPQVFDWKPMQSIGYKEAVLYLRGDLKKENLAETILKSTMAYAKRQMTWFKKDQRVEWVQGSLSDAAFLAAVERVYRLDRSQTCKA